MAEGTRRHADGGLRAHEARDAHRALPRGGDLRSFRSARRRRCTRAHVALAPAPGTISYVSDTPVAQVAHLLLQTSAAGGGGATLRVSSLGRTRTASTTRASPGWHRTTTLPYPCRAGVREQVADRDSARMEKRKDSRADGKRHWKGSMGTAGVLLDTYEAPGCRAPTPLESRHTAAALDLLTHTARMRALAARAALVANLGWTVPASSSEAFDDTRPLGRGRPTRRHLRGTRLAPRRLRGGSHWEHPSDRTGEEREPCAIAATLWRPRRAARQECSRSRRARFDYEVSRRSAASYIPRFSPRSACSRVPVTKPGRSTGATPRRRRLGQNGPSQICRLARSTAILARAQFERERRSAKTASRRMLSSSAQPLVAVAGWR